MTAREVDSLDELLAVLRDDGIAITRAELASALEVAGVPVGGPVMCRDGELRSFNDGRRFVVTDAVDAGLVGYFVEDRSRAD